MSKTKTHYNVLEKGGHMITVDELVKMAKEILELSLRKRKLISESNGASIECDTGFWIGTLWAFEHTRQIKLPFELNRKYVKMRMQTMSTKAIQYYLPEWKATHFTIKSGSQSVERVAKIANEILNERK